MANKLSRGDLIAIAERLLISDRLTQAELLRLIEEFESNLTYPDASELVFTYRNEFRNAAEIVDFALGREKLKKLSREELVEVARKLMTADIKNEIESQRLGRLFIANIPHPGGLDLIFYPKIEFETPEALVDYALAYPPPRKGS